MKSTLCICLTSFLLSIHTPTLADVAQDYASAKAYIANQHLTSIETSAVSHAKDVLPEATSQPNESKYYSNPEAMTADVIEKVNEVDSVAAEVVHDAMARPKITVNPNSPEIVFANTVQDNAAEIADGTYQDCSKEVVFQSTSTQKSCSTSMPFELECLNTLSFLIKKTYEPHEQALTFSRAIQAAERPHVSVGTPADSGFVTGISIHVAANTYRTSCFVFYGLEINGVSVGPRQTLCGKQSRALDFDISNLHIPFKDRSVVLTFSGGKLTGAVSGSLVISYEKELKAAEESWSTTCPSVPASCQIDETICFEEGSSAEIEGVSVNPACWKKRDHYQCGSPVSASCQALEEAGCTQISSVCEKEEGGACQSYAQTWSCPDQKAVGTKLQCGEASFCMDGSCETAESEENTDFGTSITELSAVSAAGEEVEKVGTDSTADSESIPIFAGRAAHCREVVLGSLNCCTNHGWANGNLGHCTDEERTLGQAREKGDLVVSVGRYCSSRTLGVCTKHKEGYCIFPSKIAYDVQVGGRRNQLGRGFGSAQTPDCSGISASDIGNINFSKIDFSNTVNDVVSATALPSGDETQTSLEALVMQRIQDSMR